MTFRGYDDEEELPAFRLLGFGPLRSYSFDAGISTREGRALLRARPSRERAVIARSEVGLDGMRAG